MPKGFTTLPQKAQKILLKQPSHIEDVQGEIKTTVYSKLSHEERSGYYWANNRGQFRIQYYDSKELVVFNGNKLYWKIPENGFVWVISDPSRQQQRQTPQNNKKWLSSNYKLTYSKGVWEYFSNQISFALQSNSNSKKVKVTLDLKKRAVVQRELYKRRGRPVLVERFEDVVYFRDTPFFRTVEARVRLNERGDLLVSESKYVNLQFNQNLPASLFTAPEGRKRSYSSVD